jgi:hypothetical protein
MLWTDLETLRHRLWDLGIPTELIQDERRGAYLASLLGQRLAGETQSVDRAAEAAGVKPATVRQWRRRSDLFAHAEWRARHSAYESLPAEVERPEPAEIRELRARLQRAQAVCRKIGPGPWPGNELVRRRNTAFYEQNRRAAIDALVDLRSYGVTKGLGEAPPPLGEYPKPAFRAPSISGTGEQPLWPPSAFPAAVRRALGNR